MKTMALSSCLAAGSLLYSLSVAAAPLTLSLSYPLITYQSINTSAVVYSPGAQIFSLNAAPTAILFSALEGPALVVGTKNLQINVLVDNAGALLGGVGGDDLVLSGTVTRGTNLYTGVLLTAEAEAFGFVDSGTTDQYQLRFRPNGGVLLPIFGCADGGVQVTSEASTFTNSFTTSFTGRAKGNIGLADSSAPFLACPYAATGGTNYVECHGHSGGLPGAYVSFDMPQVSDNCDTNPIVIFVPPSGSFFSLSEDHETADYVVNVYASDAAGNTNACSFTVHLQDTLPPEFADPTNPLLDSSTDLSHPIVLTNDAGHCYATFAFLKPKASDNCCPSNIDVHVSAIDQNGITITLTDLGNGMMQGQFPLTLGGSNVVTTTASDERGNTAQHQVAVTVLDTEAPVILCATNQTVECTGSQIFFAEPSASDNCPCVTEYSIPANGSALGVGQHTIVFTAYDCSGNSNQCSFTVTVVDTTAPGITCPPDLTIECGQSTATNATGRATAHDTCDDMPVVAYTDALSGSCPQILRRTWFASDYAGNTNTCIQTITIQDTTRPKITAPAPLSVQRIADVPAPNPSLVASSDSCSAVTNSFVRDSYATNGCVTTVTRTYKATDAGGNYSTADQTITVQDTTRPNITAPAPITVQCFGNIPPANTNSVAASDNSGAVTTSLVGDTFATNGCVITVTRIYQATDACGNYATSAQTITVQDTNKPTITCPAPISLCAGTPIPAPNLNSVMASDNCGVAQKSFVGDVYLTNSGVIAVTRTYKATEACGNYSTCSQVITIYPLPFATIMSSNTVAAGVVGNTASVPSAGPGTSYSWAITNGVITAGQGTSSITFTAGTNGSVSLAAIVTSAANCSATGKKVINITSGPTGYTTYTTGGWGAPPNGNNAATLLTNIFKSVYQNGFIVGGNYTIKLTSASAIIAYLPDGGTGAVLKQNFVNPLTTMSGVLGSQVSSLKLNVDASTKGYTKSGLGNLKVGAGNKLAGQTVAQVLTLANAVLGGKTAALPSSVSLSDLISLLDSINRNFDGGTINNGFLTF